MFSNSTERRVGDTGATYTGLPRAIRLAPRARLRRARGSGGRTKCDFYEESTATLLVVGIGDRDRYEIRLACISSCLFCKSYSKNWDGTISDLVIGHLGCVARMVETQCIASLPAGVLLVCYGLYARHRGRACGARGYLSGGVCFCYKHVTPSELVTGHHWGLGVD
ncbi:hypothetical protein CYPRO_0737 [Cyclonatronum proteinivorum]|uniref:Uncharacterized protein n=1 Tax=Cyclonatronum proteinivorum TaxID=1457365 RepID=A0A345UHR9_9BACT|nr:hypothetical protein CYPRO_0737 [Cyclonatronum proteinivorum]